MNLKQMLITALKKTGIHYQEKEQILSYNFTIDAKLPHGSQIILINEDSYLTETSLAIQFKKDAEALVIEFITRANVNMEIGYFVYDETNGILTFIIKTDCADSPPSKDVILESVMLPMRLFGEYGYANALYYLCSGLLTPKQAIDFVER